MKHYTVNVDKLGSDHVRGDILAADLLTDADIARLSGMGAIIESAPPAELVPEGATEDQPEGTGKLGDTPMAELSLDQLREQAKLLGIDPLPKTKPGLAAAIEHAQSAASTSPVQPDAAPEDGEAAKE